MDFWNGWRLARRAATVRLYQIGRYNDAERELRYLWADMPEGMKESALRFAIDHGMAGLAFALVNCFATTGQVWLGAIYPFPNMRWSFLLIRRLSGRFHVRVGLQPTGKEPRPGCWADGSCRQLHLVTKNRAYRGRDKHLLLNPERTSDRSGLYRSLLNEPLIDRSIIVCWRLIMVGRAIFANGLPRLIIRTILSC